ncbi:MAG TPA: hypothetical protein VMU10_02670 [Desulfomonilia bacterium]|nr:hypothetical protein [Desulfomonilia bacterium]
MKNDFELALYITSVEDLKHFSTQYTRIYFGNEFCERLIPSEIELGRVLDFVHDNHVDLTFLTPYVTNEGMDRLHPLLSLLGRQGNTCEVVFNDWGVLERINRESTSLQPVMGRLLNKMKRGPRLMHFLKLVPKETVDYFKSCSLEMPVYQKFLMENRVTRAELDNLLQGIDLDLSGSGMSLSLYMPYAYVTTTRLCLACRSEDPDWEDKIALVPCSRECRMYTFKLTHPVLSVPLIRKGNTMFFKNETMPKGIASLGFDRIVFEPEVPI